MITSRQQLEAILGQSVIEGATLDTYGERDHFTQHVILGGQVAALVISLRNLALLRTLACTLCCLLASLLAFLALARLVLEGEAGREGGAERGRGADELRRAFGVGGGCGREIRTLNHGKILLCRRSMWPS